MMSSQKTNTPKEMARFIEEEIKAFVQTSPLNRIPGTDNMFIFDEPLVQFADGDDPIFTEYKTILNPPHITPREALAKAFDKSPDDVAQHISVISWILPITTKVRESIRRRKLAPSRLWANTRSQGGKFNDALREHVVKLLTETGYMAVAPILQPYYKIEETDTGYSSNWSERHVAYVAGLGTFGLSDGFITERGIAHRCGSVVTNLKLPASPRTATSPYSNCLFHATGKCGICITRCPAGAITENGHDKAKCYQYQISDLRYLREKYGMRFIGCGFCQTKVPCEFRNPTKKVKKE